MANTKQKEIKEEIVKDITIEEPSDNEVYPTPKYQLGQEIEYRTYRYNPYRGALEEKIEKGIIDQRMLIQNIQRPIWLTFYLVQNEGSLISEESIVNVINKD